MTKKMSLKGSTMMGTERIDLLIERDAGNEFLVLMGSPKYAIENYRKLERLCVEAIMKLMQTDEIANELVKKVGIK